MMAFGCLFSLILLAGPMLLLLGLLGQRNPTMPRCRACKAPLTATAAIPMRCPGCAMSLEGGRGVRFGGWRPRWSSLLIGGAIVLLTGGVFALATMRASPGITVVGGVPIERSVTEARFEERTATIDQEALDWVRAHLTHGDLPPDLARRAAAILIEEIAAGTSPDHANLMVAIGQAEGTYELRELAEAMLTTTVDVAPGITARAMPSRNALSIVVSPPDRAVLLPNLPITSAIAVLDVRVDGVSLAPSFPADRARPLAAPWSAQFADPDGRARNATRIEVDLILAAFDEPLAGLERGLPGPPDRWPAVLAERRVTVEAERGGP